MIRSFAAVALVIFIAGCAHDPVPTDTGGNSLTMDLPNGAPTKSVLDSGLAAQVPFGEAVVKDAGGIAHTRVNVRNTTSQTAYCEYKVVFYDESGFEIGTPHAGWKPIAINGGEARQLEGSSTVPGAKKCTVYLRYEKPIR